MIDLPLAPCPKCGDVDGLVLSRPPGERVRWWAAYCPACDRFGPVGWGVTQAQRLWNQVPRPGASTVTDPEFVDLVARMRDAQRRYFKTRSPDVLQESKRLEREVDAAVDAASGHQQRLF